MRCPYCKEDSDKVVDSRVAEEGQVVRRRRECIACAKRFTTYERVEEIAMFVVKKDQRRETYERAKVLSGVYKACEKRPVPLASQEKIANELETMIREKYDREVPSKIIGEFIMTQLSKIDQVAYVRFASVYRDFQDVGHFMKELKFLLAKPK